MNDETIQGLVTASSKLLTVLTAYWNKLTLATTAKEPLNVLFHNWTCGLMEVGCVGPEAVIHRFMIDAVDEVEKAQKKLADASCLVFIELVCCGAFVIGNTS